MFLLSKAQKIFSGKSLEVGACACADKRQINSLRVFHDITSSMIF